MNWENVYFINGTAYAGKSTLVKGLAARYDGIACEENYHEKLMPGLDPAEFPCLTYTRDLQDWHDFIRRSPEAYEAWYDGVTKECEALELRILPELAKQGRPVFVDTNIRPETLRQITDSRHVLILLADPELSVRRFFDRPDREKQFLYRLIQEEPDPAAAMENYRQGLMRIHSRARYDAFLQSGFPVLYRDEGRSAAQTLALAAERFGFPAEQNSALNTQAITLCPMTAELYHAYYREYQNDPDLCLDPDKCTPYVYSPEWVDRYIRRQQELHRRCFAILHGEELVGEVVLKKIEAGKCATLSISMKNAKYKDRGFGTAAERLIAAYVFSQMEIPVLYADTLLTNTRSQHVLEKVGFRLLRTEGDFKYYALERPSD